MATNNDNAPEAVCSYEHQDTKVGVVNIAYQKD